MGAERRVLQETIFPRLKTLCESRGASFQAVDLRWGVNEEAQLDQKTMDICLNEIHRCQKLSPKPNFIILLGDKYGWQPVPDKIPSSEMDEIRTCLTDKEKKDINDWYIEDKNALPPEFVLQPRGEGYKDYGKWRIVEERLRETLRAAVNKLNFTEKQRGKYFASATHQEIVRGALNPPENTINPEEHVFAYLRTIKNLPETVEAKDYIDLSANTRDLYSKNQLIKLKADLKGKLRQEHRYEYRAEWKDGCVVDDIEAFGERVYTDLSSIILHQLDEMGSDDPLTKEIDLHEDFKKKRLEHFTGQADALTAIRNYLHSDSKKVFSIIGASGSGKTSIMAKAIEESTGGMVRQAHHDSHPEHVEVRHLLRTSSVFRFIGTTSNASDAFKLFSQIINQITIKYDVEMNSLLKEGEDKKKFSTLDGLREIFSRCLQLASKEMPLLIFLDALDQLSRDYEAISLYWLPEELPANVKIVVSALPELMDKLSHTEKYELKKMRKEDASKLLEKWVDSIHRTLQVHQRDEVINKFTANGRPLYLRLAFEKAKEWRSYTTNTILKPDIDGMLGEYFDDLQRIHGKLLVEKFCGYMLSGKYQGLTENELLDLFVFDKEYWNHFVENCHPDHRGEVKEIGRLPIVVWSRLFLDMEPYLTEKDAVGIPIISFYHRRFIEYAQERYLQNCREYHKNLDEYFISIADPTKDMTFKNISNRAFTEISFQLIQASDKVQFMHLIDAPFFEKMAEGYGDMAVLSDLYEIANYLAKEGINYWSILIKYALKYSIYADKIAFSTHELDIAALKGLIQNATMQQLNKIIESERDRSKKGSLMAAASFLLRNSGHTNVAEELLKRSYKFLTKPNKHIVDVIVEKDKTSFDSEKLINEKRSILNYSKDVCIVSQNKQIKHSLSFPDIMTLKLLMYRLNKAGIATTLINCSMLFVFFKEYSVHLSIAFVPLYAYIFINISTKLALMHIEKNRNHFRTAVSSYLLSKTELPFTNSKRNLLRALRYCNTYQKIFKTDEFSSEVSHLIVQLFISCASDRERAELISDISCFNNNLIMDNLIKEIKQLASKNIDNIFSEMNKILYRIGNYMQVFRMFISVNKLNYELLNNLWDSNNSQEIKKLLLNASPTFLIDILLSHVIYKDSKKLPLMKDDSNFIVEWVKYWLPTSIKQIGGGPRILEFTAPIFYFEFYISLVLIFLAYPIQLFLSLLNFFIMPLLLLVSPIILLRYLTRPNIFAFNPPFNRELQMNIPQYYKSVFNSNGDKVFGTQRLEDSEITYYLLSNSSFDKGSWTNNDMSRVMKLLIQKRQLVQVPNLVLSIMNDRELLGTYINGLNEMSDISHVSIIKTTDKDHIEQIIRSVSGRPPMQYILTFVFLTILSNIIWIVLIAIITDRTILYFLPLGIEVLLPNIILSIVRNTKMGLLFFLIYPFLFLIIGELVNSLFINLTNAQPELLGLGTTILFMVSSLIVTNIVTFEFYYYWRGANLLYPKWTMVLLQRIILITLTIIIFLFLVYVNSRAML
jgi:hypothetical protein